MSAARRPPASGRSARPSPGSGSVMLVCPLVSVVCVLVGLMSVGAGGDPPPARVPSVIDAVVGSAPGRTIPGGYLGLSLETSAVESYAGTNPGAPDPLFVRLVRNLVPGASPVLRIGGDTADWSWWPVPGVARPRGVYITLDNTWLSVTDGLARALGARLILGLNLEADNAAIAAAEARNMRAGIAASSILAFELGNEPSIYGQYPWYRTPGGRAVTGRPANWNFARYLADFTRIADAVDVPALAGPSVGGSGWFPDLGAYLAAQPRVRIVTVHRYPFQLCRTAPNSPRYPTLAHLLAPAASVGFAESFAPAVAVAHARGLPLRIDELNTVSCGAAPAVSQTFGSALWALDTLFALAQTGVDGVQMHTFPGAGYQLFTFHGAPGARTATVAPEYYGLVMFARAAPAGSRLVAVRSDADGELALWATRGRDARTRVLLVNSDASHPRTVRLRVPGAGAAAPAKLERLSAPSVASATGIALEGQSYGPTTATGALVGRRAVATLRPVGDRYVVSVPAGSAVLLTVR